MVGKRRRQASVTRAIAVVIGIWFAAQLQRVAPPAYLGASSLMVDLGITAAAAGLLASVYFPIYGLMQIPSGILADQASPRRNLLVGGFAMVVAGLAFALAPGLEMAVAARAAIGVSAGLFWLSSLKLFATLPGGSYARRMSVIVGIGSIASILGLAGLPVLLSTLHWRLVAALAVAPMLLVSILLLLTEMPEARRASPPGRLLRGSWEALGHIPWIVARSEFWAVTLPAALWTGAQFAMLTWLPRFATDALAMPAAASGLLPALSSMGTIAGSAMIGYLYGRHRYLKLPLYFALYVAYVLALAGLASGLAARAGPLALYPLLVAMGVLNACFFIPLAWIREKVEPGLLGTASGVMNGLTFLPAFFLPWAMGILMDVVDRPTSPGWQYSGQAYYLAFWLCAAVVTLGLVGSALLFWHARSGAAGPDRWLPSARRGTIG